MTTMRRSRAARLMVRASLGLVLIAVPLVARAQEESPPDRPNVVVLLSDDQRLDTIAALGNPYIDTPNLDRLVREGTTFTRIYCQGSMSGAVCLPSRAMLLAGRSLFRTPTNLADTPTMPETFAEAGYMTFGTGKWHNGGAAFARSFQDGGAIFFGGMSNHTQVPIQPFSEDGDYGRDRRQPLPGVHSSKLFTDEAVGFLEDYEDDRPYFVYVAFTAPHDPRTPPAPFDTYYDDAGMPLPGNYMPVHPFSNGEMTIRDEALLPWPRTPEAVRGELADYYGMITHMDQQIGRILAAIEERGELDRTVIAFTSDHGLAIGSHGLLGKQNLYEHSMRSPLVIRGPGAPADATSDAMGYLFDIFPTLATLADVPIPSSVEGRSLFEVSAGSSEARPASGREAILTIYKDGQRAVRDDRWKLIRYPQVDVTQVFDLASDPLELRNLADSEPDQRDRLTALMEDLQAAFDDDQPLVVEDPRDPTFTPPSK